MTDQLISFETAVLAKEKGFDIECSNQFHDKGIMQLATPENTFERPTQSLLQKWLREKYNIHLQIYSPNMFTKEEWVCHFMYIARLTKPRYTGIGGNSYEEVLEKGLVEALKIIK
jgi:hypothetical protein